MQVNTLKPTNKKSHYISKKKKKLLYFPLCVQQLSVVQAGSLSVNSSNVDGFTPLHVAALHGRSALVSLLIRHGANVNARTNQNATPLHLASQNSHIQVPAGTQCSKTVYLCYITLIIV